MRRPGGPLSKGAGAPGPIGTPPPPTGKPGTGGRMPGKPNRSPTRPTAETTPHQALTLSGRFRAAAAEKTDPPGPQRNLQSRRREDRDWAKAKAMPA
jgi:hypothetical protein